VTRSTAQESDNAGKDAEIPQADSADSKSILPRPAKEQIVRKFLSYRDHALHQSFTPFLTAYAVPPLQELSTTAGRPNPGLPVVCVPGMMLMLEVEVLYGPIGRNR
jgi:hypothetical protein